MLNLFKLRAKWTRSKRPFVRPQPPPALVTKPGDLKVGAASYLVTLVHLGRIWKERLFFEGEWFLKALRGELPPDAQPVKNYTIHHVNLPKAQYFMALEVLTTRLGVKP